MFIAFVNGFLTSLTLIVAIGAQNAFVLRQGIRREHVFTVALICALSDALLISLGVAGVGRWVRQTPMLLTIATYGGAAFLFVYGLLAARRAFAATDNALRIDENSQRLSLKAAVLSCLAFTYLNPHVYLDTVVLLGSISSQYEAGSRWSFGVGAVISSVVWFFSLAYGARMLAPVFEQPRAWRMLDASIAVVMFAVAISLLRSA